MEQVKDYLDTEHTRNKKYAALYEELLKKAFPNSGITVMVGHHIGFEFAGDISTENEIPSADCLLFDLGIMARVFGESPAVVLLEQLAVAAPGEREDIVIHWLAIDEAAEKARSSHLTEVA